MSRTNKHGLCGTCQRHLLVLKKTTEDTGNPNRKDKADRNNKGRGRTIKTDQKREGRND